ncbi:MAG: nuclear transport factor 2 family protein [Acidobacteria bacterium]|nr:nuclear transport factor 2 family protein [Acidobacteriota bacterium]MBS1865119.1 nuclear transport factor 2 family protein [Acidobacteriota bacterium]
MKFLAAMALFAVSLFPVPGAQDKGSADEIQIRQLERAWNQAEMKQEIGAVDNLVADSMVYTDYDGTFMHKKEYMKWIVDPDQKADHLIDEGMNVQVYGNAAVVTGVYRETGTNKGKTYVIRSRYTDTWIRRAGVWQCVASHSTLIPK